MKRVRRKLGIWLLMPVLVSEMRLAQRHHQKAVQGPLERYWMGRITGVGRLLYGWGS